MPQLDWGAFAALPGSQEHNFEKLCRALVRRHYSQYGTFTALINQPGVEFHLKLDRPSPSLGDNGRWWGWQCKWYQLPPSGLLGSRRRSEIVDGIEKARKYVPGLTDWVLWTKRPLAKKDQAWFSALETPLRLHQWTEAEVDEHLSGEAAIFRATYFGELVLTPAALTVIRKPAVARVGKRWRPKIHQTVDAERCIRRILGEPAAWEDLSELAASLKSAATDVEDGAGDLDGPISLEVAEIVKLGERLAEALTTTRNALDTGDYEALPTRPAELIAVEWQGIARTLRQLRSLQHPVALIFTNFLADLRMANAYLDEFRQRLSQQIVVVAADAGGGKTQLSAEMTEKSSDRPDGLLLFGSDLSSGQGLDDLARRVVIQGEPVRSMQALLAAVDAAAQRAMRRLPVVIDGLSESDDPRDWKPALQQLAASIEEFPNVTVVCTIRGVFLEEAIPDGVPVFTIPGFEQDTIAAIRKYFDHYKIDAYDAELPLDLLSHPLTLNLYCEVTNPTRSKEVGIEATPRSLNGLFERYLVQVSERITELAPAARRFSKSDVYAALDAIGDALWNGNSREVDRSAVQRQIGEQGVLWTESIVKALVDEGVLLTAPADQHSKPQIHATYDLLGGHIIASAISKAHSGPEVEDWLREFGGQLFERKHPLGRDIFDALVGIVPRRFSGCQLWKVLDGDLRDYALAGAASLEAAELDAETVDALSKAFSQPPRWQNDYIDRLWNVRGLPNHPLNAEYLDAQLRPMNVSARDLRWTEWIRRRQDRIIEDLLALEQRWKDDHERTGSSRLRARWCMWLLTSTVRELRDQATRALYWFGRGQPSALFSLAIDGLTINDLYVPERLLAACYGVAMAHQLPNASFEEALGRFLAKLGSALTGADATCPTSHVLIRLYVQGITNFAMKYHPGAVVEGLEADGRVQFASPTATEPIRDDDAGAEEVNDTLHMDFENYTMGRLFDDRGNYDMNHVGYREGLAHVRGVVWSVGWRKTGLGETDRSVGTYDGRGQRSRIERYGKKYGWIGFYTYAGVLQDRGQVFNHGERLSDIQIDPSFPTPVPGLPIDVPTWARNTPKPNGRWLRAGVVKLPKDFLQRPTLGSAPGPWIAVAGFLSAKGAPPEQRSVWGILRAFLVARTDTDRLVAELKAKEYPGNLWMPDLPDDYYTFAGEIPWSPQFAEPGSSQQESALYFDQVPVTGQSSVDVEILAHAYTWESYHSELNNAGGALVPSKRFSSYFDLRSVPQSFDQVQTNGALASRSFSAPAGFEGRLLYLRQDLLHQYASGRDLVSCFWGERELRLSPHIYEHPAWLREIWSKHAHVWRKIATLRLSN